MQAASVLQELLVSRSSLNSIFNEYDLLDYTSDGIPDFVIHGIYKSLYVQREKSVTKTLEKINRRFDVSINAVTEEETVPNQILRYNLQELQMKLLEFEKMGKNQDSLKDYQMRETIEELIRLRDHFIILMEAQSNYDEEVGDPYLSKLVMESAEHIEKCKKILG